MIDLKPLHIDTARALIDFEGRSKAAAAFADDQLKGTVAIHNILAREGFAYLADEVGMGKTYIALGVVGLLRHFHPELRVLYVAPRENIQTKWRKEYLNFVANNWRLRDLRVRSLQDDPVVDVTFCRNLETLAHVAVRGGHTDLLTRLTSYSVALQGRGGDKWRAKRDKLTRLLPWLPHDAFDLRSHRGFKDAYARAINVALPKIDLLVVDEGHNLRAGFGNRVSDRNRVLGLALGLEDDEAPYFDGGGPRVDRVLVLSATPLETDFEELYRQLEVFGLGNHETALALKDPNKTDAEKKAITQRFMVRRLTGLPIGTERHTKNMYRREWRRGGVTVHGKPLEQADEKQRLVVGLVQKKVFDVLTELNRRKGNGKRQHFGRSFQMGMLASFESFFQTTKVKAKSDEEESDASAFDQSDQTDDHTEREGVDARSIDHLAKSYRRTFGASLPHPKMDAVARALGDNLLHGEKTLVFVRRVASVGELAEKVSRAYDAWLLDYIEQQAGEGELGDQIRKQRRRYERLRREDEDTARQLDETDADETDQEPRDTLPPAADLSDTGGRDTFFSWFFRGDGPSGLLSGARFRKNRLTSESSALALLFDDNHLAWLFDYPDDPFGALADALGQPADALARDLRREAFAIYDARTRQKTFPRRRVFRAYQEAALERLAEAQDRHPDLANRARILLDESYGGHPPTPDVTSVPDGFASPDEPLAERTLFTELAARPSLKHELWPEPDVSHVPDGERFQYGYREREQRREMLAAAIGLGHPFVDLWLHAVRRLGSIDKGVQEQRGTDVARQLANDFLDTLERQPRDALSSRHELAAIGGSFHLIMDTNFPELRGKPLGELPRYFADTLGRQVPIGGMSGGINAKLVKQFRMPGYPYVLITTDVLQEGEDLHTFASRVVHYGITWTPSAMEQRVGRIDRIGSLTHRRLGGRPEVDDHELLQVQYPYLADTVELAQTRVIFQRMDRFISLLHEGVGIEQRGPSAIDFTRAVFDATDIPQPVQGKLESPFDVKRELLEPDGVSPLEDVGDPAAPILAHYEKALRQLAEQVHITWDTRSAQERWATTWIRDGKLLPAGASTEGARRQPFKVRLHSTHLAGAGDLVLLRFISPVGIVDMQDATALQQALELQRRLPTAKLCASADVKAAKYNLSAEVDVVFHDETTQPNEVLDALERATSCADALEEALLSTDLSIDTFTGARETEDSDA